MADRNRGKFRSFLLGSLEHFLAREWTKGQAQKRGGGQVVLSLEGTDPENRYLLEVADALTPEKIFERRWAIALLDEAMSRLRHECRESGKGELFAAIEGALFGQKGEASYAEIAVTVNKSQAAIQVAVYRLRRRYRELVREEIARTVVTPADVDEELRHLFQVLRE